VKISIALMVAALMLAGSVTVAAQSGAVGYPPAKSPYVDLEQSQEFGLIVGNFHAHRDPADVGPQSGTLIGAHYEWRASGPLELITEIARASSERRLIDPAKSGRLRELGTVSRPLYMADFDLGMSLTGGKTWHRLVPEVSAGVGLISDLRSQPDSGGMRFGTRFAFNGGAGLRYVATGRWQIRGDVKDRLYSFAYPQAYYIVPVGGTSVLPATQAKSFWMNNPTLSLGLAYLF
jgi:hypothetical protein